MCFQSKKFHFSEMKAIFKNIFFLIKKTLTAPTTALSLKQWVKEGFIQLSFLTGSLWEH